MDFEPTAEQMLVAQTARAFARDVLVPRAAVRDRDGIFPEDEMRALGGLGLLGVVVPEAQGGSGMGPLELIEAVAAIAEADASVAVTVAVTNLVADVLSRYGSAETQARFLPALCKGELVAGAFALSEAGAGSDAASLRTSYRTTNGVAAGDRGFVIDGQKAWITSGDRAGVIVVIARSAANTEGSRPVFSAFAVPGHSRGLTAGRPEKKMGQRGSSTVALSFDGVEVPASALLGSEGDGFRIAMSALDGGRINVGAMAVGVARAAFTAARSYARQRRQFGRTLASFQAIQMALADAATATDAAWLLVQRAAWRKQAGHPVTRMAAAAKLLASESAVRVCDSAVQIHGGYGYSREFPVERFLRDARVMTIYEGTSQIQRLVIARSISEANAAKEAHVHV